MRRRVGENAGWIALILAGLAGMAWLGLAEFGWNDYDNEAGAAISLLVHGHFGAFLEAAPVYGGSLLERSPFALAANLWNGGEVADYRMLALPCLLASGALGMWLVVRMGRDEQPAIGRVLVLILVVANPLTLLALETGHPEELLGGTLCVAAVLLAAHDRGLVAGLVLGAAIANKQWALLAVGPVLVALPSGRLRCMAVTGAVASAFMAPFLLSNPNHFFLSAKTVSTTAGVQSHVGEVFQPWQIWWFLGPVAHMAPLALGTLKQGARIGPGWVETYSHPLIIGLSIPLTILALLRRRKEPSDALLLLALLLLERCVLDPWDNLYYPLPFVLALLAWEVLTYRRLTVLALISTLLIWADHRLVNIYAGPDIQSIIFIAWTVPLALWLASALYAPGAFARLLNRREVLGKGRQPLRATLGDKHEVLDAHAEATG